MPSAQDPIRDQLIEARRNQILDAAAQVFGEKGFHRATTKEIANTAGLSEGTIYNYFANKADLLVGMLARLAEMTKLSKELDDALRTDAPEFLAAVFRHRMRRIEQNHAVLQAILPEILINPELREYFYQEFVQPLASMLEQHVQARVEQEHIHPFKVSLVVRLVQSMFIGLLVMRIFGDEMILSKWDELPELVAALVFKGLSPQDGA